LKKILLHSALLVFSTILTAQDQRVNFDSLILPISQPSADFQEYLVQLAWLNNPEQRINQHNIRIAEEDVTIAKWEIANDMGVTFNINENNIKSRDTSIPDATPEALMAANDITQEQLNTLDATRGVVDLGGINNFPIWNVGLIFNLGRWINRNNEIEKAQQKLLIEHATVDKEKVELRAEVIRRYQAYLHAFEIYKIRVKAEEDITQTFQLVKNRFKEGTVDFEEFSRASNANQNAKEATLNAKGEITSTKIDLEEIIGIPFEKAERLHDQHTGE